MDENNIVNEDLANIISSFEKRTQQISEEQREARERFVVALSELSRQYDLLREWTEKSNADLKDFFEKLGEKESGTELLEPLNDIAEKLDALNEQSAKLPQTIETELQALGDRMGIEKDQEKLLQPIMVIADRIDRIAQEFGQSLSTTEQEIKESLLKVGEMMQLDDLLQETRTISEQIQTLAEGLSRSGKLTELVESLSNDLSMQLGEVRVLANEMKSSLDEIPSRLAESNEKLLASIDAIREPFDSLAGAMNENNEKLISSFLELKQPFDSLTATVVESNEKVAALLNDVLHSVNAYSSAFTETNERLITTLEEANASLITRQTEASQRLLDKMGEMGDATKRLSADFQDSLLPVFERIERAQEASNEKQLPVLESIKQEIRSVFEGITLLQEGFKILAETVASLERKQDILPAVIDNRGQNIEDKLGTTSGSLTALKETMGSKTDEVVSALSGLSQIMKEQTASLEKQLIESSTARKDEAEKIAESLSFIPDNLTTYLESNREILESIKETQATMGNISAAIENLTKSIVEGEKRREEKRQYETAQNHLSRGVILFYRGSLGAAEKEIQRALELHQDYAEAYLNLGMILGEKGETDKAIEHIQKALEIEPGLEEAYNNLGVIQLKGERYEEAVMSFNEAVKTGFKYPQLYLNMAKSLIALDRIPEAVDSLKKAVEIDPTNAEAQELLSTYAKES